MTKPIGLERTTVFQGLTEGGKRVGLLGGSFNPPHQGHVHISNHALKELSLDFIWWLVSPQNPLKHRRGMEHFTTRAERAKKLVASERRIKVTAIETHFRTRFTVDIVRELKEALPEYQMVWLMGADNLSQISLWHNWRELLNSIPIAVFDRAPYATRALASKAACVYSQKRLKRENSHRLSLHSPPRVDLSQYTKTSSFKHPNQITKQATITPAFHNESHIDQKFKNCKRDHSAKRKTQFG